MTDADTSEPLDLLTPDRAKFRCPECSRRLPLSAWTKCDDCGAHLRVRVEVEVPAQGGAE